MKTIARSLLLCLMGAIVPSSMMAGRLTGTESQNSQSFFVDPIQGNDLADGKSLTGAWKTLARLNEQPLGPGDHVSIAPGPLTGTLMPKAEGTRARPVVIQFTAGRHEFNAESAVKLCYFVSNSADSPLEPRPIGILLRNASHVRITGDNDCDLIFRGRMTYCINDHSEDIRYENLSLDMVRPTVSEFRVLEANANSARIQPADGSTFRIEQGQFAWTGDLGPGWTMTQEADPATGKCWRRGQWNPFSDAHAEELPFGQVELTFNKSNPGLVRGHQYQFRNTTRDTTSAVNTRCKDITFQNCRFYALPGMGIVSQFTDGITFRDVSVAPRPGSSRTCPAWADCFHFSGCRGNVLVENCIFSGTQDDPINVHGTYLRIIEKPSDRELLVRFMHPQAYGFAAFQPGDHVELVNHRSLRQFASAKVRASERKSDRDWLLTLDREVPNFSQNDVIDNVSWYPDVTIRNCAVTMDSCRGLLISSRGKVLIEGNTFANTAMSAILIAGDANSWFESGPVRNVTIRSNRFKQCADLVIAIVPEIDIKYAEHQVHAGIRILNNVFESGGIAAKSVKGLTVQNNQFGNFPAQIHTEGCASVSISGNRKLIVK